MKPVICRPTTPLDIFALVIGFGVFWLELKATFCPTVPPTDYRLFGFDYDFHNSFWLVLSPSCQNTTYPHRKVSVSHYIYCVNHNLQRFFQPDRFDRLVVSCYNAQSYPHRLADILLKFIKLNHVRLQLIKLHPVRLWLHIRKKSHAAFERG